MLHTSVQGTRSPAPCLPQPLGRPGVAWAAGLLSGARPGVAGAPSVACGQCSSPSLGPALAAFLPSRYVRTNRAGPGPWGQAAHGRAAQQSGDARGSPGTEVQGDGAGALHSPPPRSTGEGQPRASAIGFLGLKHQLQRRVPASPGAHPSARLPAEPEELSAGRGLPRAGGGRLAGGHRHRAPRERSLRSAASLRRSPSPRHVARCHRQGPRPSTCAGAPGSAALHPQPCASAGGQACVHPCVPP